MSKRSTADKSEIDDLYKSAMRIKIDQNIKYNIHIYFYWTFQIHA